MHLCYLKINFSKKADRQPLKSRRSVIISSYSDICFLRNSPMSIRPFTSLCSAFCSFISQSCAVCCKVKENTSFRMSILLYFTGREFKARNDGFSMLYEGVVPEFKQILLHAEKSLFSKLSVSHAPPQELSVRQKASRAISKAFSRFDTML